MRVLGLTLVWVCSSAGAQSALPAIAPASATPSALVAAGFRVMNAQSQGNCVSCHALPGQTGLQSSFGPTLVGVGARYSTELLRQWVTDARTLKPNTLMPPFGTTQGSVQAVRAAPILNAEEIEQVVAALQTLR